MPVRCNKCPCWKDTLTYNYHTACTITSVTSLSSMPAGKHWSDVAMKSTKCIGSCIGHSQPIIHLHLSHHCYLFILFYTVIIIWVIQYHYYLVGPSPLSGCPVLCLQEHTLGFFMLDFLKYVISLSKALAVYLNVRGEMFVRHF